MAFSKAQLAFLACTIFQEAKDGKVIYTDGEKFRVLGSGDVLEDLSEGEKFFLHTPIHGPNVDGATNRPLDVPSDAYFWFQSYMNGNLLNGNGWGTSEPQLPTFELSPQFKVLQEFIAAEEAPTAA